jgi:hypothetical protein
MTLLRRLLSTVLIASLLAAAQGWAADVAPLPTATVIYLKGELRENGKPVVQGAKVSNGSTLATGDGAQARLQFPDRQVVILDQNSTLRIANYEYIEGGRQTVDGVTRTSQASFELLNGATRLITGLIGERSPRAVTLRTPQTTFTVYGTDFMVMKGQPSVLSVISGAVASENGGGAVLFNQGMYGEVTSPTTVGYAIREQDVSPTTRSAFLRLLESQKAAAAAPGAAASGGFDTSTLILLGVGAAVLGMAGGGGGGSSSATSH